MAQMRQTKFFHNEEILEPIPDRFFKYLHLMDKLENKDLLFFELCNKYGMLFLNNSLEFEIKRKKDIEYFNTYIKDIKKDMYIPKKVFTDLRWAIEVYQQKQLFRTTLRGAEPWKVAEFLSWLEKHKLTDFYSVYYDFKFGDINDLGLRLFKMKYFDEEKYYSKLKESA